MLNVSLNKFKKKYFFRISFSQILNSHTENYFKAKDEAIV